MSHPVLFYGHTEGVYASFSNFYPAKFHLDGIDWACSEQAFMSFKSEDPAYKTKLRQATSPFEAKRLGRTANLIPNWDNVKFDIMVRVLTAKFSQNPPLAELLQMTGDRPIHENCKDPWWGGGPNFPSGKDLLGKALMQVRTTLAAQP